MRRFTKRLILLGMTCMFAGQTVYGATSAEIKKQKEKTEKELESIKGNINSLEQKKSSISSQISEMNNELVELLVIIQVLEADMAKKEEEIIQAEADYEAAREKEESQYEAMKKRIKFMYESGDTMYLEALLNAESISDMLNKAEFINEIYTYDRNLLNDYQETKEQVARLKQELEAEKSEMEVMEADYKEQQGNLEQTIEKKKKEVANFESELSKAKVQAKNFQDTITAQTAQIKKLAEEEKRKAEEARKKAEAEAAKSNKKPDNTASPQTDTPKSDTGESSGGEDSGGSSSGGGTSAEPPASGGGDSSSSGLGSQIASYGCQFVGNPYVLGGTSLTNGADCSGFTMSVHANFGISIPRTSGGQLSGGKSIPFSDIQPGDIVCYAGHVAIYIGNGSIVHASTPVSGIKISNVGYRTILGVRRYY